MQTGQNGAAPPEKGIEGYPGMDESQLDSIVPAARPSRISFWRAAGTLLSLGLLAYLIYQGWGEFTEVLSRLPLEYFFFALGLMMLSRLAVSLRWFVLLRSAGVKMSIWQCLRLTFMGLFASNFLPTTIGGDLVRMAGALYLRLDAGVSAASLVVDRLVGMAGMASLAPFGLVIVFRSTGGTQPAVTGMQLETALFTGLSRFPVVRRLYERVAKFTRSLVRSSIYWLRHPAGLFWALACTYGHMLFTFLAVWLLLRGMHQSISFWWIGALWSLNYFITTFVPISINGLGLQEISIATLYSHFGGVSNEAGLALAVLMRLVPMAASLPGVFFLPDILRPIPKGPQHVTPAGGGENIP